MVIKTSGKNLLILTVLQALFYSSASFLYDFLVQKNVTQAASLSSVAFLLLLSNGIMNLSLLKLRERKIALLQPLHVYFMCSFAMSFTLYIIIWPLITHIVERAKNVELSILILFIILVHSIVLNTITLLIQHFFFVLQKKGLAEAENTMLKAANTEAANVMLRQQIQPHFLFNALSTLKTLYNVRPDEGEQYLVHLANFLRATVSENKKQVSLIKDELSFCEDYLSMQQMRFGKALICHIQVSPHLLNTAYLPTFSLQPLIENAIKHNELTIESPVKITIYDVADRIVVRNNLQPKNYSEPSTKQGLINLTERYRLLSQDEVVIQAEENTFSISIKMLTSEYSNNRR